MSPVVLDWNAAVAAGPEVAGGKGWNLGRLARYGFPVPTGGVLNANVYRDLVATAGAEPIARGAVPLPATVVDELAAFLARTGLDAKPVAVRSSATAEDSASASFAGIHRSYLNVTGLPAMLEAVRGCYASLWTPQAVAYRQKMGLADGDVAAAVVIMAMVDARVAGVGFSCDPQRGRTDRCVINAAPGLGEALVSGHVEPDRYEVDLTSYPPKVAERHPGGRGAAGLSLTDDQAANLAKWITRVRDSLGRLEQEQDVEWAHDGQRFWLVQARPVTRLPEPRFPGTRGQPLIWSNGNLKDIVPGVQSPLGWSILRTGFDQLMTATLEAAGHRWEPGMTWARLYRGRAYFNLTAMQWSFYHAMGMTPAELNRTLGGHQPEIAVPPAGAAQRWRWKLARGRLSLAALHTFRSGPPLFAGIWRWAEEREQADLSGFTRAGLLDLFGQVPRRLERFVGPFQMVNSATAGLHDELVKALTPTFGDRATGLVNAMLAGAAAVTSAEQGERLVRLGNLARHEAPARAFFGAPAEWWQPARWQEALAGTRFGAEFSAYLNDYGHRAVYEVEIMHRRWREDPTYLLEAVRSQVLSGQDLQVPDRTAMRQAARQEVLSTLGRLHPTAFQVRLQLPLAARGAALREWAKSVLVKAIGVARLAALECGRRLTAEGRLAATDDVFLLTIYDLEAWLTGQTDAAGFGALVADRRAERAALLALEAPDVIIGETAIAPAPPPKATGPVLAGLGVSSGRARGVCRIILHPHEGSKLQPGDVLVAPSTDPAWTPLFLRACAVVTAVGGNLSHGAIVAREYGLPAVSNVPGLLQAVQDGEWLTVDGDSGRIYRG